MRVSRLREITKFEYKETSRHIGILTLSASSQTFKTLLSKTHASCNLITIGFLSWTQTVQWRAWDTSQHRARWRRGKFSSNVRHTLRVEDFDFCQREQTHVDPVIFGCRCCRGNETRLHSHLSKGISGNWTVINVRYLPFGISFAWLSEYYVISKFILSYNGPPSHHQIANTSIMCFNMDIFHWNGKWLEGADFWSSLGIDSYFDPLLIEYTVFQFPSFQFLIPCNNRRKHLSPLAFLTQSCNIPYYCGPRMPERPGPYQIDVQATEVLSALIIDNCHSLLSLSSHPVKFGA